MKSLTFTLLLISSIGYGQGVTFKELITDKETTELEALILNTKIEIMNPEGYHGYKIVHFSRDSNGSYYKPNGYESSIPNGTYTVTGVTETVNGGHITQYLQLNDSVYTYMHPLRVSKFYKIIELNNPNYVAEVRPTKDIARMNQIVQLVSNDIDIIVKGYMAWQGGRLTGAELTSWTKSTKQGLALVDEFYEILDNDAIVDYMDNKKANIFIDHCQAIRGSAAVLVVEKE